MMLATIYEDSCRCKMCFANQNAGKVMLNRGGNARPDDVRAWLNAVGSLMCTWSVLKNAHVCRVVMFDIIETECSR